MKGGGQEELPHAQGQGQRLSARLRQRGNGREELPHIRGQGRPGGATLRPRPGMAAGRSYPMSEAKRGGGQKKLPRF